MATLSRARTLAMDKLGVELPRLTFPKFHEEPAGRYVSPSDFYAILPHITHPTKRAFVELLYLLGIRPGQLKSTETSNVRVENGKPVALVYKPAQASSAYPMRCRSSGGRKRWSPTCGRRGSLGAGFCFTSTASRCSS